MLISQLIDILNSVKDEYGEDTKVVLLKSNKDPSFDIYHKSLEVEISQIKILSDGDGYVEYIEDRFGSEMAVKLFGID